MFYSYCSFNISLTSIFSFNHLSQNSFGQINHICSEIRDRIFMCGNIHCVKSSRFMRIWWLNYNFVLGINIIFILSAIKCIHNSYHVPNCIYLRHFWYLHHIHCFRGWAVIWQLPPPLQSGMSSLWVFRLKNARQA